MTSIYFLRQPDIPYLCLILSIIDFWYQIIWFIDLCLEKKSMIDWKTIKNPVNIYTQLPMKMINVNTCFVNNLTQTKDYDRPTVGRSSAEWRPKSDICLPTVFWYNVIAFGWYHDVNFCKKSADCRPIIASPMRKHLKIGGSIYETFYLCASTKG